MAELQVLYPGFSPAQGPSATPADFAPPGGSFVVAWLDGAAVGCGGIKRLELRTAEMKRVYVAPEARGRGIAAGLVAALEGEARAAGYARMRLDTGPTQPHARQLYLARGYQPIADYNQNPYAAYWFERAL